MNPLEGYPDHPFFQVVSNQIIHRIPTTVLLVLLSALVSDLAVCESPKKQLYSRTQAHMGTQFTMRVWAYPEDEDAVTRATDKAFSKIG
ncbi:MAG: hypothetical protein AAGA96_19570 [Verrucomicrobiota bacterium]